MLYHLIKSIYTSGAVLNDVPILVFSQKFDNHVLTLGRNDIVDDKSRVAELKPFNRVDVDKLSLNLHIDQNGHAVFKDIFNMYRSKAVGGSLSFTRDTHAKSSLFIRYTEEIMYQGPQKISIISSNKCLTATESLKTGDLRLSFQQCTGDANQVWGPVPKDKVISKLDGIEGDFSRQESYLVDILNRLDGYASTKQ